MEVQTTYSRDEAQRLALEFFDNDALQAGVFIDKYALRDKGGRFHEVTYFDAARRWAREFARIEARYNNPLSEEEIFNLLTTGAEYSHDVTLKTGLVGPQGSPMFGIGNPFQIVSTSNCSVIAAPQDTLSGILNTARDMANLYKRRFGVGTNLSTLRPEGAAVSNAAGTSTGAWSFADFYSFVTRMVGQAGRRGALMLVMHVKHPDIAKFVTMKADLTKVTGANVSVLVTDEFMAAVESDSEFTLQWPVDVPVEQAKVVKTIRAKELFTLIAETACKSAEPGVIFWDHMVQNQPLAWYPGYELVATNPCGEQGLPHADSCRLISNYVAPFVVEPFTPHAAFDFDAFYEVAYKSQRLADDLVDLEAEALIKIRETADTDDEKHLISEFITKCLEGRRTGLGIHGLADALARLGIRYDSDNGIEMARQIYDCQMIAAYQSSIDMAKERGTFPIWNWETEKDCTFWAQLPPHQVTLMKHAGRRNGVLLTNAPTGTRSLLSQNCSSGLEPVFGNWYSRNRKIDQQRQDVVPDYIDAMGDAWKAYKVFHPNVKKYLELAYDNPVEYGLPNVGMLFDSAGDPLYDFDEFCEKADLPPYFVTANDIRWEKRVEMQSAIQSCIDNSISSTINLPRGTTPDVVAGIYLEAWKAKCKGVTVYVDGSREAQVLSTDTGTKVESKAEETLLWGCGECDRIEALEAEIGSLRTVLDERGITQTHRGTQSFGTMTKASFTSPIDGSERKVYVYVGKNDLDEPVEVFVTDERGDEDFHPYAAALGRLASLSLKYGIDPEEVAQTLSGLKGGSMSFRPGGMATSVPDLVSQLLKEATGSRINKALVQATDSELPLVASKMAWQAQPPSGNTGVPVEAETPKFRKCNSCQELTLKDEGGCFLCVNCGFTKCG
jgi:ribonucleoside-diphosphate reductase alpha chain